MNPGSAIGPRSASMAFLGRALRHKLNKRPTPPTWYQKNALMFGRYQVPGEPEPTAGGFFRRNVPEIPVWTSLPPVRQCHVVETNLWSRILQRRVRFKVSTAALREIDRKGGLDEYLLLTGDAELGGDGSVAVIFKRGLERALRERNAQLAAGEAVEEAVGVQNANQGGWWHGKIMTPDAPAGQQQQGKSSDSLVNRVRASLDRRFWEQLEQGRQ